ncbi:MAG: hypothetical protein ACFFDW_14010 [Candidatus Thorarchaeota archaeon]
MTSINLYSLGTVEISKKLIARVNLKAQELFDKYPNLSSKLSFESKDLIRIALNQGLEPQLRNKSGEILEFFEAISKYESQFGFGPEETEEEIETEILQEEEMEVDEITVTADQETYDKETGEIEGKIILGDSKMESKLLPIKVNEKIILHYDREGNLTSEEAIRKGSLEILNPSEEHRLWDIKVKLENIANTNLKKELFKVKELDPQLSKLFEYSFDAEVEPELQINEFISTSNDPDVESYSLNVNTENEIFMKINLTNITSRDLEGIIVKKMIPEDFSNIQILDQSKGNAELTEKDGKQYVQWDIDNLEQNAEATLTIRVQAYIANKDVKIRTGEIIAKYHTPTTLSGIEIGSVGAYTNNSHDIISSELEEEPNTYDCKFIFENKSDFAIRLVNADVYKYGDPNTKYVDIDPSDIPEIPAGGNWESKSWILSTEEGKYPKFKTKVEFFTIADHQITTLVKMKIQDIVLAVAAAEGNITYSVDKLPSFTITPFNLNGKIINSGGADLNEITLTEHIQTEFLPPKPEDIEVYFNGSAYTLSDDAIEIVPDNDDPTSEHTVKILLTNLKETPFGALKPGNEIEFKYPITAFKPTKESLYHSNSTITANTYPPGKPIVIKAEPIEIEVIHLRRNIAQGKDTKALETEGEYEVTLRIRNMGEAELIDYIISEKIDANMELLDVSHNAEITEKEDAKVLLWRIDSILPGKTIEVTYKIKAIGDTSVSEN